MRKPLCILIIIFMIVFLTGCEYSEDISVEDTKVLYEKSVEILNGDLELNNYRIIQSNNQGYSLSVVVIEDYYEMSLITVEYEKNYKDGYLSTFDKINNIKSKTPYNFNDLGYEEYIKDYAFKFKEMLDEKYIEEMTGTNEYSINGLYSRILEIKLKVDELKTNNIFELNSLITSPYIIISFNKDFALSLIYFDVFINGVYHRIQIYPLGC